jgi:hypothetical protein
VTVPYYFDHHIHKAIIAGLRRLKVDCLTAEKDGRPAAADENLLSRATDQRRVFITNDSDLMVIAAEWWSTGKTFGGVFRLPQDLMTIGEAIETPYLIDQTSEAEEWVNRVVYLPL